MHLFVCEHGRPEGKASCASRGDAQERIGRLKALLRDAGLGSVRVSRSGCLGPCEQGPNLLLYPQRIWFHEVAESDLPAVVERIRTVVEGEKGVPGCGCRP